MMHFFIDKIWLRSTQNYALRDRTKLWDIEKEIPCFAFLDKDVSYQSFLVRVISSIPHYILLNKSNCFAL